MGQREGTTPLHVAAATGAIAEVRTLLTAGVAVDAVDGQGRTALLLAVQEDRVEVARVLLDAGASPNVQAANEDTPWLLAGASGRTAILAAMIAHVPDV